MDENGFDFPPLGILARVFDVEQGRSAERRGVLDRANSHAESGRFHALSNLNANLSTHFARAVNISGTPEHGDDLIPRIEIIGNRTGYRGGEPIDPVEVVRNDRIVTVGSGSGQTTIDMEHGHVRAQGDDARLEVQDDGNSAHVIGRDGEDNVRHIATVLTWPDGRVEVADDSGTGGGGESGPAGAGSEQASRSIAPQLGALNGYAARNLPSTGPAPFKHDGLMLSEQAAAAADAVAAEDGGDDPKPGIIVSPPVRFEGPGRTVTLLDVRDGRLIVAHPGGPEKDGGKGAEIVVGFGQTAPERPPYPIPLHIGVTPGGKLIFPPGTVTLAGHKSVSLDPARANSIAGTPASVGIEAGSRVTTLQSSTATTSNAGPTVRIDGEDIPLRITDTGVHIDRDVIGDNAAAWSNGVGAVVVQHGDQRTVYYLDGRKRLIVHGPSWTNVPPVPPTSEFRSFATTGFIPTSTQSLPTPGSIATPPSSIASATAAGLNGTFASSAIGRPWVAEDGVLDLLPTPGVHEGQPDENTTVIGTANGGVTITRDPQSGSATLTPGPNAEIWDLMGGNGDMVGVWDHEKDRPVAVIKLGPGGAQQVPDSDGANGSFPPEPGSAESRSLTYGVSGTPASVATSAISGQMLSSRAVLDSPATVTMPDGKVYGVKITHGNNVSLTDADGDEVDFGEVVSLISDDEESFADAHVEDGKIVVDGDFKDPSEANESRSLTYGVSGTPASVATTAAGLNGIFAAMQTPDRPEIPIQGGRGKVAILGEPAIDKSPDAIVIGTSPNIVVIDQEGAITTAGDVKGFVIDVAPNDDAAGQSIVVITVGDEQHVAVTLAPGTTPEIYEGEVRTGDADDEDVGDGKEALNSVALSDTGPVTLEGFGNVRLPAGLLTSTFVSEGDSPQLLYRGEQGEVVQSAPASPAPQVPSAGAEQAKRGLIATTALIVTTIAIRAYQFMTGSFLLYVPGGSGQDGA